MTIEQLFGNDTSDVDEANFERVFGGLGEGVFAGIANECEVIESAPAAMTVEVKTGTLVTGGVFGRVTAQDVLVIAAADGVNPRIDRVVARRNNATNLWSLAILTGTPAGAPVPPSLTRNGTYEISLAQVLVATGVVQINTADITDERYDRSVCGWVTYGGRRQAVEVLDRDLSQVEVVSTVVEASIYSFTIPASALGATGGLRLSLGGDLLENVAGTLVLKVKLGATTILTSQSTDFANDGARRRWLLDVLLMNSAVNAQKCSAVFRLSAASAFTFPVSGTGGAGADETHLGVGYGTAAEDTAESLVFDVTVEWSVSSANLSFRKEQAVLELLPPA